LPKSGIPSLVFQLHKVVCLPVYPSGDLSLGPLSPELG
jgi:hypothetical protein